MALIVCDTNCWIEASTDPSSDVAQLLTRASDWNVRIKISKHSLSQLIVGTAKYGPAAESLARRYEEVPYYPIGTIDELLGTISELSGTLDDIRKNDALRETLGSVAASGTDIRDRGALIDALLAKADYFVTSDRGLVGAGPRARIESTLSIRVRTPSEMTADLRRSSHAG